MVYLLTGKAGSGKSTYARRLRDELQEGGTSVVLIDGDEFRKVANNQDFTDEGRRKNLIAAAKIAKEAEQDGFVVIMAFVSPKKEWRQQMRAMWQKSCLIYLPGGSLWPGTSYEMPDNEEW